jgi:hypothetical protein
MTEYTDIAYSPLSAGGSMVLLQEQEASSSATISFTSGIDSTYKEYVFRYNKVSSSVDGGMITINGSIDAGSNYNVAKTTTFFAAQHNEADDDTDLGYNTSKDVAQDTEEAIISYGTGNAADEIVDGYLHLYNPASTTFVKHFIGNANTKHQSDYSIQSLVAGYFNTTSAVNAIQFKMDQGNMDTGTIKLYGVN